MGQVLAVRKISFEFRKVMIRHAMPHVLDNANDGVSLFRHPRTGQLDLPAERVLARKESIGQCLVNNHHGVVEALILGSFIGFVKIPSRNQRRL